MTVELDLEELVEQAEQDVQHERAVGLADVAAAADLWHKTNDSVDSLEEQLKEAKKARARVEEDIRMMLAKSGQEEFKCTDAQGRTVQFSKSFVASITEKRKHVAFQWLRDKGFEDIIKNQVSVPFNAGGDAEAQVLLDYLQKNDIVYDQKETVHAGTLKAFVNEQLSKGVDIPKDVFGVYEVVKVKTS